MRHRKRREVEDFDSGKWPIIRGGEPAMTWREGVVAVILAVVFVVGVLGVMWLFA